MANGIHKDLGKVTAYSYAKAAGYTGTEEQFQAVFNEFTENSPGLITRMDTAVERAEAAVTNIDATIQDAVDDAVEEATASAVAAANQAVTDAQAAQTAAEGAVTQANAAVTQANAAVTAAQAAQSAAEDAAESFVIDDTLTVSGAAADAKKTGDEVSELKSALNVNQTLTINGAIDIPLTNFFQRSGENRIWYREGRFINGFNISITNQNYDVTPYYTNYLANDWTKSLTVDNTSSYLGIAIRKSDKSDISGLTQEQLTALVSYGFETVLNKEFAKLTSPKFVHISFDDCVFWTDLIDKANKYTSAFDNAFLGYLKGLHDDYGAVFTLNCFCTSGNYSIENVPSKFATDFSNNKDWLRFAFHAEDANSDYSVDDTAAITASYNKFTNAIYTMTSDIECIDRVSRLGNFKGSLNNIKAVRDCSCGIVGLLTSDDTRTSYYLTAADNTYILSHSHFLDATNKIMFLHSQKRLESTTLQNMETWLDGFKAVSGGNFANYLELFTHENQWNTPMLNKMKACFQWLTANNYTFVFMEELFRM